MNTVLWGFSDPRLSPVMIQLQNEQHIAIKAWIGDTFSCPHCTHNAWDITKNRVPDTEYVGIDETLYNRLIQQREQFMEMYSRGFDAGDKTIHDYLNMFHMFINFFYQLLIKNEVQLVIFYTIPHDGSDFILYQVAKGLGIKTLVFYQSLFPNKFFFFHDVNKFADFAEAEPFVSLGDIHVSNEYEKELFYMEKKSLLRGIKPDDKLKWKKSLSKIPIKIKNIPKTIIEYPRKALIKFLTIDNKIQYKKNNKSYGITEINTTTPFVYFPLHLQPELTTSALGNQYVDQLLAVEKLRMMIPEHWNIYVKENPKQTEFMRSPFFYDRLKRIKNTYLVSKEVSTYFLLEKSVFPATITGTIGWEAISGGKNVLIFGNSWYKNLPGVFLYTRELKLADILEYKIDHQELEEKLSVLMSKMADGVIDICYNSLVDGFDVEKNIMTLTDSLKKILTLMSR